jgi:hypothetical protein
MFITPPNFMSVRLTDEDKQNYVKIHLAAEQALRQRLSTADLYRLAMQALAEKHGVRGIK